MKISDAPVAVEANEAKLVTHEDISRLAFSYFAERGCQGGSPEEDWFRAEHELSMGTPC